jgi:nucleotide-binding universal stress UspA family protein
MATAFSYQKGVLMENFSNILVISRMIPDCLKAIKVGVSLARKYDAKLLVMHLVSNPVDMMAVNAPGLFPTEQYKNYMNSHQEAQEQLDKLIKQEIRGGFPIKELISDRDPVEEIVKVVEKEKIDLILMSSHEEGRLEHALFGGENDAILRKMPSSIMLVKK